MKDAERLEELDGKVAVVPRPREPGGFIRLGGGSSDDLGRVGGLLALRAGTGRSTASRLPFPIPPSARGWFVTCHGTRTFARRAKAVKIDGGIAHRRCRPADGLLVQRARDRGPRRRYQPAYELSSTGSSCRRLYSPAYGSRCGRHHRRLHLPAYEARGGFASVTRSRTAYGSAVIGARARRRASQTLRACVRVVRATLALMRSGTNALADLIRLRTNCQARIGACRRRGTSTRRRYRPAYELSGRLRRRQRHRPGVPRRGYRPAYELSGGMARRPAPYGRALASVFRLRTNCQGGEADLELDVTGLLASVFRLRTNCQVPPRGGYL